MRKLLSKCSLVTALAMMATGCAGELAYNLPPAQRLMRPGPGVDGPGPGVLGVGGMGVGGPMMGAAGMGAPGMGAPGMGGAPGGCYGSDTPSSDIQQVSYCESGGCDLGSGAAGATSQIAFGGDNGIQIQWDVSGQGMFDSAALMVPGRQDFPQGAIYRLKVSNIPGRPEVSLYPTLEVAPVTPRTDAYLAHAPIPVQLTEEDFDQVLGGNFVTKVIYLPDPEFQELALAGVETLVSTRLDPGCDPIAEADRRGSILAILRIGSKDLEAARRGGYGNVMPASYGEGEMTYPPTPIEGDYQSYPDESYSGDYGTGGCEDGSCMDGGSAYNGMPMGMPTSGFAPQATPPHGIAAMGPQWGMPMSGTPIGLPGPPHIPLGAPAGLQRHVMKNRTRIHMPPPVSQLTMSVKQRPGLNYPRPVNNITVDETNRAPLDLVGGTVPPAVPSLRDKMLGVLQARRQSQCDTGYCR